jgi:hypothetical protein
MGVTQLLALTPFDVVCLSHAHRLQMLAAHWRFTDLHKGCDPITTLTTHPTLLILACHHFTSIVMTSKRNAGFVSAALAFNPSHIVFVCMFVI